MKRTHLVGILFVIAVIAAAGVPALSTHAPAPPATAVDVESPTGEQEICPDRDFSPAPDAETVACSRCPDGSPQCFSNKQCDTLCGTGKGTGVCQRINSCYSCCICAVAHS